MGAVEDTDGPLTRVLGLEWVLRGRLTPPLQDQIHDVKQQSEALLFAIVANFDPLGRPQIQHRLDHGIIVLVILPQTASFIRRPSIRKFDD